MSPTSYFKITHKLLYSCSKICECCKNCKCYKAWIKFIVWKILTLTVLSFTYCCDACSMFNSARYTMNFSRIALKREKQQHCHFYYILCMYKMFLSSTRGNKRRGISRIVNLKVWRNGTSSKILDAFYERSNLWEASRNLF